jgi:adenylate cyclase
LDRLHAAGAVSIGLDLILAEPDRYSPRELARLLADDPQFAPLLERASELPTNDERLAGAVDGAPVALGIVGVPGARGAPPPAKAKFAFAGDDPKEFVPSFPAGVASVPVLVERAAGLGAVNWLPSDDQIVRRVPLLLAIGGYLYPSLPLEALRISARETTVFVRSSGGSGVQAWGYKTGVETVRVGSTVLPTDANGELWLRFALPDRRRYISAHRVLEADFDPKEVAGRHILIGASASGLLDLRATPLAPVVPGVEIHAQALEQILSGDHLVRPPFATGAELAFLVLSGIAIAWLMGSFGPTMAALLGAAAVGAVSGLSWLAYEKAGFLLDPVYPSLAVVALYLAVSLYSYIKSETDRRRIRSAFGHYVAAPLVEELAKNHDKLKLGGEMREVTILFADVRGFSKIAEGQDAEALIRFVNKLFTPLSDIILEQRGTIDKFMGDAVMAFWNAPLADPDHASLACRAALRMQAELDRLNRLWAAEARSRGETFTPVRIGIGLNTGDCCVGNVGSPQRFDYSLLGDPVNIASRLEGETKSFGIGIILGERTAAAAQDFASIEIDSISLRGKDRPERIFALLGDRQIAESERFRMLAREHAALLGAIGAKDTARAAKALKACRSLGWTELDPLYDHYARRLELTA